MLVHVPGEALQDVLGRIMSYAQLVHAGNMMDPEIGRFYQTTQERVTDISSGYRATRADTLHRLILEQDQFWTSEVTIEALRQRARVVEVPVTFLTRRGGVSKKPKSLRYGWNFSKAIVKTWLR